MPDINGKAVRWLYIHSRNNLDAAYIFMTLIGSDPPQEGYRLQSCSAGATVPGAGGQYPGEL